ncbi:MAG TPA: zinc-dependent metalloprotease family protein, partial [Acidobacteriota bacterium]|nr:zinc-dependent metalloprotease family protein [Acidobacteriota bacterium]
MTRFLFFSFLTLSLMVGVGGITLRHAQANHALTSRFPASQGSQASEDGLWQVIEESSLNRSQSERQIIPSAYRVVLLNQPVLANLLKQAPLEFSHAAQTISTVMTLPMPDGTFSRFRIEESPVMEPELAAQFPEIKTYCGQGIDDPTAIVRFDRTPAGFHAMVLSAGDTVYIDPYQKGDTETCISYFKRDYQKDANQFRCLIPADNISVQTAESTAGYQRAPFGTTLRTYRLALAATGEYTAFHGGTVAGALAAITTSVNRVNAIYGRELAIRMVLIAQESSIIYTSSGSDPYTNDDGGQMLGQNQANLDRVIGTTNYDIGHVFSTGGGGIASRGGICNSNAKARGVTGLPAPVGDSFDVDFVAHEMGHQFGANHPFNGTTGNCGGGNRAP